MADEAAGGRLGPTTGWSGLAQGKLVGRIYHDRTSGSNKLVLGLWLPSRPQPVAWYHEPTRRPSIKLVA